MKYTVRFHDHTIRSFNHIVKSIGFPKTTIEIGCFEGESTFNIAAICHQRDSNYKHYAIDPYDISDDLPEENIPQTKEMFLSNLNEFEPKGVVEFINKKSFDGLIDLYNRGVKADFIYVDGDHRAPGVLQDCVLGFELLNKGGVMLFDDSMVWRKDNNPCNSPKMAVDNFMQCYWNKLEIFELPGGYQSAVRKL
jgi:predicted O-methyltransferase YrrM